MSGIRIISMITLVSYVLISIVSCAGRDMETTDRWDQKPSYSQSVTDDTVLTVSGKVNNEEPAFFTLEQLMALPAREFSSYDPWLDDTSSYTGFELYSFLEAMGIEGTAERIILTASNDYTADIALEDVKKYRYTITYAEDGKVYSEQEDERNKSPLSVAVRHEDYPELEMELLKLDYVWWLAHIEVR